MQLYEDVLEKWMGTDLVNTKFSPTGIVKINVKTSVVHFFLLYHI